MKSNSHIARGVSEFEEVWNGIAVEANSSTLSRVEEGILENVVGLHFVYT